MKLSQKIKTINASLVALSAFLVLSNISVETAYAGPRNPKLVKKFRQSGLVGSIPSVSKSLKKVASTSSLSSAIGSSSAPPKLVDLIDADISGVFWKQGSLQRIINNEATAEDCNNFHRGGGSCHLAGATLEGMGTASEGEISLCYMSRFPQAPSGVTFEGNGLVRDVFDPPSGSNSKYIGMTISGFEGGGGEGEEEEDSGPEKVVARVYSLGENGARWAYQTDLLFCDAETNQVKGFNRIEVASDGRISILDSHSGESRHAFMFTGYLTTNSTGRSVQFDAIRPRNISVESVREDETYNSRMIIGNGVMTQRTASIRNDELRSSISRVEFSGNGLQTVRFQRGAFLFSERGESHEGGASWNGSRYLAEESNGLLSRIDSENLGGDFYSSVPDGEISADGLPSCDHSEFDAQVTLDMSDPGLQELVQICEPIRNTQICWENDALRAAQEAFAEACSHDEDGGEGGGGEGGGGEGPPEE